ncbi:MAG: hypothetical protein IJI80_01960 [Methanobrevibacter sp.]|uniref:hypothetical protein n=1 Tax=Methanobrevibacter sp. TaxID=66852 RepID=UPI0025EB1693|nr:hypothetical protein [Methanobrevibacter sp.]MBQ6138426.1 hypothetical protein [Methanobrevibacter sp.]
MMKNDIIKDQWGLLYSSELLLSIILLIFIIGVVANLSDGLNEKMLSEEEFSSIEAIAIESSDYLLNNPGNPENWEDDDGLNNGIVSKNIIPGLAIKNKNIENGEFYSESASDEMIMSNAISYKKLIKIKNNYNSLVDGNLFNDSVYSSMAIYPLNSKIRPIIMGYDFDNEDDNVNDNNIVTVNRTVKCDFYSNFVVYNFNDFDLFGENYEDELCNHDSNPNLTNHGNDEKSIWLCKNFKVYKESLNDYNYYLISDESIKNSDTYWIIESLNRTSENKEILNQEVIDLNPFLMEDMENSSGEIYSIHFNVPKNSVNDFKTVLVAIPKNMTDVLISNDEFNYDYFRVQDVNFILKIGYK